MLKTCFLLLHFVTSSVYCNFTFPCSQEEVYTSYLDAAIDMISKAKLSFPEACKNHMPRAVDCADLLQMGHNKSGVYKIWPLSRLIENKFLDVYCDMDTDGGGWTVIQRRDTSYQRPQNYFHRNWQNYKEGFGDIEKDFWLGNDNIFALTNQKLYSVRFDLKDTQKVRKYAVYERFWIEDETRKYTLHLSDFTGNAGDSLIAHHNNQKFSTKDQDNDNHKEHCARDYTGGWWFNACHLVNLNGHYHYTKGTGPQYANGIVWKTFKGVHESLDWTEIKIRPKNFKSSYVLGTEPI